MDPWSLNYVPDYLQTHETCDSVVREDPGTPKACS